MTSRQYSGEPDQGALRAILDCVAEMQSRAPPAQDFRHYSVQQQQQQSQYPPWSGARPMLPSRHSGTGSGGGGGGLPTRINPSLLRRPPSVRPPQRTATANHSNTSNISTVHASTSGINGISPLVRRQTPESLYHPSNTTGSPVPGDAWPSHSPHQQHQQQLPRSSGLSVEEYARRLAASPPGNHSAPSLHKDATAATNTSTRAATDIAGGGSDEVWDESSRMDEVPARNSRGGVGLSGSADTSNATATTTDGQRCSAPLPLPRSIYSDIDIRPPPPRKQQQQQQEQRHYVDPTVRARSPSNRNSLGGTLQAAGAHHGRQGLRAYPPNAIPGTGTADAAVARLKPTFTAKANNSSSSSTTPAKLMLDIGPRPVLNHMNPLPPPHREMSRGDGADGGTVAARDDVQRQLQLHLDSLSRHQSHSQSKPSQPQSRSRSSPSPLPVVTSINDLSGGSGSYLAALTALQQAAVARNPDAIMEGDNDGEDGEDGDDGEDASYHRHGGSDGRGNDSARRGLSPLGAVSDPATLMDSAQLLSSALQALTAAAAAASASASASSASSAPASAGWRSQPSASGGGGRDVTASSHRGTSEQSRPSPSPAPLHSRGGVGYGVLVGPTAGTTAAATTGSGVAPTAMQQQQQRHRRPSQSASRGRRSATNDSGSAGSEPQQPEAREADLSNLALRCTSLPPPPPQGISTATTATTTAPVSAEHSASRRAPSSSGNGGGGPPSGERGPTGMPAFPVTAADWQRPRGSRADGDLSVSDNNHSDNADDDKGSNEEDDDVDADGYVTPPEDSRRGSHVRDILVSPPTPSLHGRPVPDDEHEDGQGRPVDDDDGGRDDNSYDVHDDNDNGDDEDNGDDSAALEEGDNSAPRRLRRSVVSNSASHRSSSSNSSPRGPSLSLPAAVAAAPRRSASGASIGSDDPSQYHHLQQQQPRLSSGGRDGSGGSLYASGEEGTSIPSHSSAPLRQRRHGESGSEDHDDYVDDDDGSGGGRRGYGSPTDLSSTSSPGTLAVAGAAAARADPDAVCRRSGGSSAIAAAFLAPAGGTWVDEEEVVHGSACHTPNDDGTINSSSNSSGGSSLAAPSPFSPLTDDTAMSRHEGRGGGSDGRRSTVSPPSCEPHGDGAPLDRLLRGGDEACDAYDGDDDEHFISTPISDHRRRHRHRHSNSNKASSTPGDGHDDVNSYHLDAPSPHLRSNVPITGRGGAAAGAAAAAAAGLVTGGPSASLPASASTSRPRFADGIGQSSTIPTINNDHHQQQQQDSGGDTVDLSAITDDSSIHSPTGDDESLDGGGRHPHRHRRLSSQAATSLPPPVVLPFQPPPPSATGIALPMRSTGSGGSEASCSSTGRAGGGGSGGGHRRHGKGGARGPSLLEADDEEDRHGWRSPQGLTSADNTIPSFFHARRNNGSGSSGGHCPSLPRNVTSGDVVVVADNAFADSERQSRRGRGGGEEGRGGAGGDEGSVTSSSRHYQRQPHRIDNDVGGSVRRRRPLPPPAYCGCGHRTDGTRPCVYCRDGQEYYGDVPPAAAAAVAVAVALFPASSSSVAPSPPRSVGAAGAAASYEEEEEEDGCAGGGSCNDTDEGCSYHCSHGGGGDCHRYAEPSPQELQHCRAEAVAAASSLMSGVTGLGLPPLPRPSALRANGRPAGGSDNSNSPSRHLAYISPGPVSHRPHTHHHRHHRSQRSDQQQSEEEEYYGGGGDGQCYDDDYDDDHDDDGGSGYCTGGYVDEDEYY